ncbi:MAG: hypothetical protein ACP5QT_06010 [Brevinematia bacterium]
MIEYVIQYLEKIDNPENTISFLFFCIKKSIDESGLSSKKDLKLFSVLNFELQKFETCNASERIVNAFARVLTSAKIDSYLNCGVDFLILTEIKKRYFTTQQEAEIFDRVFNFTKIVTSIIRKKHYIYINLVSFREIITEFKEFLDEKSKSIESEFLSVKRYEEISKKTVILFIGYLYIVSISLLIDRIKKSFDNFFDLLKQ